jgi:hypothetical protein
MRLEVLMGNKISEKFVLKNEGSLLPLLLAPAMIVRGFIYSARLFR